MKKIALFIIFTIFLISCKNAQVVQNKDTDYILIENELKVWNLSKASEILETLDEVAKEKYSLIINEKKGKLEQLYLVEGIIKRAFFTGDFTVLDSYMKLGNIDTYKYEKLKEFEISDVKVYVGKRDFSNDNVDELAVMNFFEESVYLELNLQYDGNDWFIKSFSEKR